MPSVWERCTPVRAGLVMPLATSRALGGGHTAISGISGARDLLGFYVANGVTGVPDMAGDWATRTGWRREIAAGRLVGPRIVAAGPYLEESDVPIPHLLTRNAAEGRAGVDSQAALGVDLIKVHAPLTAEAYVAIAR